MEGEGGREMVNNAQMMRPLPALSSSNDLSLM